MTAYSYRQKQIRNAKRREMTFHTILFFEMFVALLFGTMIDAGIWAEKGVLYSLICGFVTLAVERMTR